ncbi:MAG: DNA-processing protein DprA [Erysipelotrichaceae bacterium]|nr:DNA-processing protein DprA [Erysipelotrichaceae bacterium]
MNIKDKVVYYSYKYNGDYYKVTNAIAKNEEVKKYDIKDNYITIFDNDYPNNFKKLRYPPWVIFYKGNISLLNKSCISIVGSRNACEYGVLVTKKIVENNKNKVVVSGLAKGIDAIAHIEALKYSGTIGIIGSGLSIKYPYCNSFIYDIMEKEQLIISEYPNHVTIKKHHFPFRNRLIASLGECLYVTQAKIKSGTMLTVNEAINLSKDVYVVPYPLFEKEGEGCNLLISQGAYILTEL